MDYVFVEMVDCVRLFSDAGATTGAELAAGSGAWCAVLC